jgi:hypothetical protein
MSQKVIKIVAELETADHDGYCSGNECEYASKTVTFVMDEIPTKFADFPVGVIIKPNKKNAFPWTQYLPEVELNSSGSWFCTRSAECHAHGNIERHSYRYTILKVEIIERE